MEDIDLDNDDDPVDSVTSASFDDDADADADADEATDIEDFVGPMDGGDLASRRFSIEASSSARCDSFSSGDGSIRVASSLLTVLWL